MPEVVCIQWSNEIGPCLGDPDIARLSDAAIGLLNQDDAGIALLEFAHDFGRVVPRSVIDDYDLQVFDCLLLNGSQRPAIQRAEL